MYIFFFTCVGSQNYYCVCTFALYQTWSKYRRVYSGINLKRYSQTTGSHVYNTDFENWIGRACQSDFLYVYLCINPFTRQWSDKSKCECTRFSFACKVSLAEAKLSAKLLDQQFGEKSLYNKYRIVCQKLYIRYSFPLYLYSLEFLVFKRVIVVWCTLPETNRPERSSESEKQVYFENK